MTDSQTSTPAVPFDPQLAAVLNGFGDPGGPSSLDDVLTTRTDRPAVPDPAEIIQDRAIDVVDRTVPGPPDAPDIAVTVLTPHTVPGPKPALVNFHGGGMMMGDRSMDTGRLADLVDELGVVAVNVEYRLAPEHPHPAPVEDCYAGLRWACANSAELDLDPDRIVVMGGSAGGGLAAGVALLARDRGGPRLAGQLLLCPMIDDTDHTTSSRQYEDSGTWTAQLNRLGWSALLGDTAGSEDVSEYAAPARAADLSGLPPAFIEAGAAEVFRDEDIDYAHRIWVTGGQAELHIWSGAFHGFDMFAPDSPITRAALDTRRSWLNRVLG